MKKATGKKLRGPSRASLREMPEVNFDKAKVRPNPYALRIAAEGISIHPGRGQAEEGHGNWPDRPSLGSFSGQSLEASRKTAKAESIPLHAGLRAAVMAWQLLQRRLTASLK